MATPSVYIGTSGWSYPHWKGRFYPNSLRSGDWLEYYAGRFRTVEVNYSFYRIPSATTLNRWSAVAPSRFRFALKLWRGITHVRRLKACQGYLQSFFEVAEVLPPRQRGPILIQLPPTQGKDVEKLDTFLKDLKACSSGGRWKLAVEFRDDSWLAPEVYRLLDRHRVALCLHDMTGYGAVSKPNDAGFIYIRRHGPTGGYGGGYKLNQIERDAAAIHGWFGEGRPVFVYYNNDAEAHAAHDAERLCKALSSTGEMAKI